MVLEVDDRDLGCEATRGVLERYVETELKARAAGTQFPGVAVHLAMCLACRTDHDGLLALVQHDSAIARAAAEAGGRRLLTP